MSTIWKHKCRIVVSVTGGKSAADYDVPTVRALTPATWKKMDIEIEWGFDSATAGKDYSGRIETYDGRVAGLHPLGRRRRPRRPMRPRGVRSARHSSPRREIHSVYIGTSKWRQVHRLRQVRRGATIVTVWTKAGNFSFLAADLENGPILAPEYGFFVRRFSACLPPAPPLRIPFALASQAASAGSSSRNSKPRN